MAILHATGSVCYNREGITYPEKVAVNWDVIARDNGVTFTWGRRQSNLPEVIAYSGTLKKETLSQLYILGIIERV